MTQVLYNLRTSDHGYRITKFTDGEVESSYLTSDQACDCPAGHRAACRHRQMLPNLLPIADSQWFWDFDGHMTVDLMGTPKPLIEELIVPLCAPAEQDTEAAVAAGQHTAAESEVLREDEGCPQHGTPHVCINRTVRTYPAWRRL